MIKRIIHIVVTIIFFFTGVLPPILSQAIEEGQSEATYLLVSEIQIAGATSTDEFIELYNPTSIDRDISLWSIQYKSSSGSKYYKKNFEDGAIVPSNGFFLITHNDFSGDVAPDMQHSSFSLASSGNVYLVAGQNTLDGNDFSLAVDSVTWQNLESGASMERQGYTGDFFLQENPNPKNTQFTNDETTQDNENFVETDHELSFEGDDTDESETNVQDEGIEDEETVESEIDTEDEIVQVQEEDTINQSTENDAESVGAGFNPPTDDKSQTEDTQEIEQPETVDTEEDTEDEVVQKETSTEIDTDVVVIQDATQEDFVGAGPASVSSDDETTTDEFNPPPEDIDDISDNNIQTASSSGQGLEDDKEDGEIILTELFPNPKNEEDEYIEIQNTGDFAVNITGWVVSDQSTSFELSEEDFLNLTIQSGQYFSIPRSLSGISLNNTGDSVYLFNASGILKDIVSYGSAPEEKSYSRNDGSVWEWSSTQSPGSKNIFDPENHAPVAKVKIDGAFVQGQEISFDASESLDEDNDVLLYVWTFGDGMSASKESLLKIYTAAGTYTVSLTVYDSAGASNTVSHTLDIVSSQEEPKGEVVVEEKIEEDKTSKASSQSVVSTSSSTSQSVIHEVIISAALPNPAGDDKAEWIELYNSGTADVDISSWYIDDEEGGSAAFLIPKGTVLPAGMFIVFSKDETDISFNNSQDELRLFDSSNRLLQSVSYEDAKEDRALVYYDGEYLWQGTNVDTSNAWYSAVSNNNTNTAVNNLTTSTVDTQTSSSVLPEEVVLVSEEKDVTISSTTSQQVSTIADTKTSQSGTSVLVQGAVTVLPGVLGSQYFYIQDTTGGIQVYQYKKNFPLLSLGDEVLVDGEISVSNGEVRIKTKGQVNIQRVSEDLSLLQPIILDQFSIENVGRLVSVSGSVIEKKKDILYMASFNTELPIFLRSKEISYKDIKVESGDEIQVTGILFFGENGYFLKARQTDDIQLISRNESNEDVQDTSSNVTNQESDSYKENQENENKGKDITFTTRATTFSWWHIAGLVFVFIIFFSFLVWEYVKRKKKGK